MFYYYYSYYYYSYYNYRYEKRMDFRRFFSQQQQTNITFFFLFIQTNTDENERAGGSF